MLNRVLRSAGPLLALTLFACGSEPLDGNRTTGPDGGVSDAGDAGGGSCTQGQTQACTCPALGDGGAARSGSQGCYNGSWLLCNCQGLTMPPVDVPLEGDCKPGRYEGSFEGEYRSGFAFGGGLDVEARDFSGMPGLAFTLNAKETGSGEFKELEISDGYVKGTANGVFPFEGVLTGTLDCRTKMFTGSLKGKYSVGFDLGLNTGSFDGPVTGVYDTTTDSFTFGQWDLLEENVEVDFLGEAGGNGTWEAAWVGEGSVALDGGAAPTPDAGVPDAAVDAGP